MAYIGPGAGILVALAPFLIGAVLALVLLVGVAFAVGRHLGRSQAPKSS